MSGICSWLSRSQRPNPDLIKSMLASLANSPDEIAQNHIGSRAAVGGSALCDKLQSHDVDGLLVAIMGSAQLAGTDSTSVARELAHRYRAEGPAAFERLSGNFALAVIDEANRDMCLAVDRMGINSLSYCAHADGLVAASNANTLCLYPGVPRNVDTQAIFNYLYFHIIPGPNTIFEGIKRLRPGHYLRYQNGNTQVAPYWQVGFNTISQTNYEDLRREFRAQLERSVTRSMNEHSCGTFLSGGTDSSTVTGLAQQLSARNVASFSIGFAAKGYDEMEFARAAAAHFGSTHHEYYITPRDIVDAIPIIAASYEQPFGNSSAVPTYYCAQLAKQHGIARLLAGDGGDELFGGNERYSKQHVFSVYDRIPQKLREALIQPLAMSVSPDTSFTLLRKFRRYVEQASIPMPLRMQSYNLLLHLGINEVLDSEFIASVDTDEPHRLIEERYALITAQHLVNRMLALDFQFTLADNDLPKVTRMCDTAGVDVEFPLLDDELVSFSARLPHNLKLSGTRLRPFFKQALSDFLPQKTIRKSKQGFGLPFGVWLTSNRQLRELAFDTLNRLRDRHIIRDEFLRSLTDDLMKQHADYYGNMVWILVMLEQWFEKQVDLDSQIRSKAS